MIIYCPTVSITWRMSKLCENGSNIDYLYETSSVLRKATETEISGLTFWLRFGLCFKNRNRTEIRFCTSLVIKQENKLTSCQQDIQHSTAAGSVQTSGSMQMMHFNFFINDFSKFQIDWCHHCITQFLYTKFKIPFFCISSETVLIKIALLIIQPAYQAFSLKHIYKEQSNWIAYW